MLVWERSFWKPTRSRSSFAWKQWRHKPCFGSSFSLSFSTAASSPQSTMVNHRGSQDSRLSTPHLNLVLHKLYAGCRQHCLCCALHFGIVVEDLCPRTALLSTKSLQPVWPLRCRDQLDGGILWKIQSKGLFDREGDFNRVGSGAAAWALCSSLCSPP